MTNVVFATDMADSLVEQIIRHAPPGYRVEWCPTRDDDRLTSLLADAEFLIEFGTLGPSERALRAGVKLKLKLVQLLSAGFEHLDTALCAELDIPVANNGGTNAPDVAEHALALMLAVYRRLVEQDRNVRSGHYSEIDTGRSTYTIHGKTVGLVGLGNIGRATAHLLTSFGARVVYTDPVPAPTNVEKEFFVERLSLEELLTVADIVSLHTPLDQSTSTMFGRAELASMKPSAVLINTCRGGVVDQAALVEALREKRIRAAGLDVQDPEPVEPNDPLLDLDNVILTPHMAGVTVDTWDRRAKFVFENCQRVGRGEAPLAIVA